MNECEQGPISKFLGIWFTVALVYFFPYFNTNFLL